MANDVEEVKQQYVDGELSDEELEDAIEAALDDDTDDQDNSRYQDKGSLLAVDIIYTDENGAKQRIDTMQIDIWIDGTRSHLKTDNIELKYGFVG